MTEPSNFDRLLRAAANIGQVPISTLGALSQRLEYILVDSGSMENAGDALEEGERRRELSDTLTTAKAHPGSTHLSKHGDAGG